MQLVELSKVVIPENRYRREFDQKKLDELQDSIYRNGLLSPIVVEAKNDKFILRAGERRLKVVSKLASSTTSIRHGEASVPLGHIPAVSFGELSELQRLEIEVEENTIRVDFTWDERARAIAALHNLRQKQNPGQTITATASEILGKSAEGAQVSAVSNALIVAAHLDDPDVLKAKDQKEALKIISKKAEAVHRARLAINFDKNSVKHQLIFSDARPALKALPEGIFDCVCSDPPYGIDADKFGSMSDQGHDYKDSHKHWKELMIEVTEELGRVTKPQAHLYLFCDVRRFEELGTYVLLAGFTVFPVPLIWYKGGGMLPFPDHGPRRTYEAILYAWKGDKRVLSIRNDTILHIPAVRRLRHGAQKPVALYNDLLGRSCVAGNRVLDCFGGTGPILVAANIIKLEATYIEQEKESFDIATSRAAIAELDDGAEEGEQELNIQL